MKFDWDDLKIFLTISEQGNLSAASRVLNISQPTVGRRLKSLEDSLGTALFDRLPDGLALTNQGEQLIPLATNMQHAANAVQRQQASYSNRVTGTVRISMYEHIAQFFTPHLPALRALCPDIELEIAIAHGAPNLSRREADIMIRECLPDIPDVIARRLGHYHYGIYAAPSYIAKHPQAIDQQRYQHCDWVSFDDDHMRFTGQLWLRKQLQGRQPCIRTNNGVVLLDALLQGVGIGVLPCFVGEQESGLECLEILPDTSVHLHLLYHKDMRKSAAVRAMLEAVASLFEQHHQQLHGTEHH